MNKKLTLIVIFAIATSSILADTWIDGTPNLYEESQYLLQRIGWDGRPKMAPSIEGISKEPIYKIGDLRKFYAIDMRNNSQYILDATCYAVNDILYIFVEKGNPIAFDKLNSLIDSFGKIYDKVTTLLGPPIGNIDNDPRIYILLMDIKDGAQPNGVRMLGYFSPLDQFKNTQLVPWTRKRSNEADLLYIDTISLNLKNIAIESVLAHELTHLIQWGNDPEEHLWVNEGIAVYIESYMGYSVKDRILAYEKNPNISLLDWKGNIENYGATYLFFAYISERYGGPESISAIMKNKNQSTRGIESALADQGKSVSFSKIFSDWIIANYLDNPKIYDGRYGYSTLDIKINPSIVENQYPIDRKTSFVLPWSAQYIEFKKEQNNTLKLTLYEDDQNDIKAQLIKIDNSGNIEVLSIESNEAQPEAISISQENNRIIFVVTSQPSPPEVKKNASSYSYSAESQVYTIASVSNIKRLITTWGNIKL
ncbi:MAG: basic secretory protein-like protein [bacterium]